MPAGGDHIPVFAVIRLDLFSLQAEPEPSVKVVEVLPDHDSAAAEAARLNQLRQGKATTYLTQATRWYPPRTSLIAVPLPRGTKAEDSRRHGPGCHS
jgi:hypothetical protein